MTIEDGIIIPTKIIDDVIYEKKVSEYTHDEEDRMNIAAKAEMVLTSALAEKEFKRVNNCKSAQEMWNKLWSPTKVPPISKILVYFDHRV